MGAAQLGAVRRMFDRVREDAGDGDLLDRYRAGRDEDAFGALVHRHGPMVLGVCRRVLGDPHAAADAFQVTFLVLARRAGTVRPPGVLGAWLYGVAVRTALKARGRELRRREVERDYASRPRPVSPEADAELRRLIDAQLAGLPEKYRLPLVLCGVEGLGKAEAARRLGLPEGTVSSRLARGRDLLRARLARRGVAVPAAALLALTPAQLRAAVPPDLALSAVGIALGAAPVSAPVLALSSEVLAAMSAPAWKLPAAALAAVAVSLGTVGLSGGQPDKPRPAEKAAPKGEKAAPKGEKGDKPRGEPRSLRTVGTLGGVDATAGTITLVRKADAGERRDVVPVGKDAAITVDGKAAKLADLKAGGFVTVERAAEAGPATAVAVTGQRLTTLLVGVDGNKLSLKVKPTDREVVLAAGAKVTHNGKDAKLADLPLGEPVTVQLSADGASALSVTAGQAREGDKPRPKEGERREPRPAKQTGQVGSVDIEGGKLVLVRKGEGGKLVLVRKGDGGERRDVVPLAKDVAVTVDGKAAKLGDVKAGVAEVERPGEGQPATKVTVTGEKVAGLLKSIDKAAVVVIPGRGNEGAAQDRRIPLAPNATFTLGGKPATAADLQPADQVTVTLTSDGTAALAVSVGAPPRREGGDRPRERKPE